MLALKSRRFDRHGIREVVGAVTDGLALGAEQSRGELRQALAEAFRGLDDALTRSAESGRAALRQFVATGKDYSDTDFKQTLATMKKLEDDFLSTAAHAAERASEKVQPELRQLIDTARTTGTTRARLSHRRSPSWVSGFRSVARCCAGECRPRERNGYPFRTGNRWSPEWHRRRPFRTPARYKTILTFPDAAGCIECDAGSAASA
jgi:hypothetical protein